MAFWDKGRELELAKLWNQDYSSQQIADLWGITRSAVVGKVFRLRNKGVALRAEHEVSRIHRTSLQHFRRKAARVVQARGTGEASKTSHRQAFLARLMREAKTAPRETLPTRAPKVTNILDLEDQHCRFILGSVGQPGYGWCGEPRMPGISYCAPCAKIVFNPVQPARTGQPFVLPYMHSKTREPVS